MENIIITGANRGIGLALVEHFLKQGTHVIATCRDASNAKRLGLLGASGMLSIRELDVANAESLQYFVNALKNITIDVLINNAGVMGPNDQGLQTIDTAAWLETFAVNAIAPFNLATALIDNLKLSKNPRIMTISSQMGSLNRKSTGAYVYRSSKAAVNKIMQVMAEELSRENIIVCPVHPGWVKTDMGGDAADITVDECAAGLVEFVNNLTQEQSGRFWTWQGEEHDW